VPTEGCALSRPTEARRDASVERLKDAYVRGALTLEDMESRVGWVLTAPSHTDLVFLTRDVPGETAILPVTPAPIADSSAPQPRSLRRARISNRERRRWIAALSSVALLGGATALVVAQQPASVPAYCLVTDKHGVVHWACTDAPPTAYKR
jgi:hypothetical protein